MTHQTMRLEERELTVQVENPVDFVSLTRHKCDITDFQRRQEFNGYFTMLDGPSYENLVRYFWVRAEIFDKFAAQAEVNQMDLIDPSLEGKTREELGDQT